MFNRLGVSGLSFPLGAELPVVVKDLIAARRSVVVPRTEDDDALIVIYE